MTAAPARTSGGRRLDESMTLLREVMERPLDPGYAAAAARRARDGADGAAGPLGRPPRWRAAVTLLLAALAGLGLATAVLALRQPAQGATEVRRGLQDRIENRDAAIRRQTEVNARLREQIAATQRTALGAAGAQLQEQVRRLAAATGELPVSGPGVRITVDDAPSAGRDVGSDPRAGTAGDAGVVVDTDLQAVVNGLWAAGAEAIAVNGQRLTALSAIRSAGQAVLVDFRPLSPPYRIDAIGDPAGLQTRFAAGPGGGYVQSLRNNTGIGVSIEADDGLDLTSAGQLGLRVARGRTT